MIRIGDVLRGKYHLESSIGRGGMGEVFCAYDSVGKRRVAVKVVSRSIIGDLLMARLQREAIAAVRVKSDYVPQLLDVDTTEEGEVFLVMELLRGQTLTQRLKQRGHLTWDETAQIGTDVLRGLIDAHAAGVVHRDLKPSNIFLELGRPGRGERSRILDFGVCKLDAPDGERLTTTGESVGTVAYMAPEQIRGASKVDERADLYSFGTVIFEALTGRLAHDATGQMALLASKLERPALRLSDCALVPLPPGLGELVANLLSRNPADRIPSAVELKRVWEALGPATIEPHGQPLEPEVNVLGRTQTSLTAGTGAILSGGQGSSRLPLLVAAGAVAMSLGVFGAMLGARTPKADDRAAAVASPASTDEPVVRAGAAPLAPEPSEPPATAEELVHGAIPPSGPASAASTSLATTSAPSATANDWVAVAPVFDLSGDAGAGAAAARPPHRRYGRPTPTMTKRGAVEPRIEDRPRY